MHRLAIGVGVTLLAASQAIRTESRVDKPHPSPTAHQAAILKEHQDHRHLPVGTRIYILKSGGEVYVYPGRPVPRAVAGMQPTIIITR